MIKDHEHEPDWLSDCPDCIVMANELDELQDHLDEKYNFPRRNTC